MANSLNLSLTDQLREFVDSRAGANGLYATPSEYLRDLIRRDMEAHSVFAHVMDGLDDLAQGRFSDKSILDLAQED